LRVKAAETFSQRDVGLQSRQLFLIDGRKIHRTAQGSCQKKVAHLLGNRERDTFLSFGRRRAEMRRGDHLIESQQRMIWRRRFLLKDIEGGAADLS